MNLTIRGSIPSYDGVYQTSYSEGNHKPVMTSLLHGLYQWSSEAPDAIAQKYKFAGEWKPITVRTLVNKVEILADFLRGQGFGPGDVGLIYAYNSPAWIQMDLAFMLAGGSSAGIYVNASNRQIHYILNHAAAKFLVVERAEDIKKIFGEKPLKDAAPALQTVIVLTGEGPLPMQARYFDDIVSEGQNKKRRSFAEALTDIQASQQAMLIYTSGTTGQPKAVVLSHGNLTFAAECYRATWTPPEEGELFSFLPLPHIAERIANLGLGITNRYAVCFCSSPLNIASELREIQPTIAVCVPRFWDKLKEGVEKKIKGMPRRRQRVIQQAMAISFRYQNRKLSGRFVSPLLRAEYYLADKYVLAPIRQQLGLTRAERTVSGAAALSSSTLDWYRGIGVRLIEAYALSESSGVLTCGIATTETGYTVGVPYPGLEVRVSPEDGEIQTRGPHVFQGYYKDEIASRGVIEDGWLKTGDIGTFTPEGHLKILGRKREIIKNAEGKMISPLFLEAQIESHTLVEQAIVIGNELPHLVALVVLEEGARNRFKGEDRKAIVRELQTHFDEINLDLASHERIRNFEILVQPFSIERDEMTATMKLKRHIIERNYTGVIMKMFDRPDGRPSGTQQMLDRQL